MIILKIRNNKKIKFVLLNYNTYRKYKRTGGVINCWFGL